MRIGNMWSVLNQSPEVPKLFIGPPGIGKTQIVYQWSQAIGRRLYVLPLAHFEPEDIKGLPWVNPVSGQLEIKRGPVIPGEQEKAVLFLDELTTVPPSKIAVALKIIDERRVGHFQFPQTFIVCAGNPPEFGGYSLDSRVISRLAVFNVEANLEDFANYLITKYVNNIVTQVIGFLKFQPKFLVGQFKEKPFPTPRTWEMVVKLHQDIKPTVETVGGCVGEGVAVEFCKFIEMEGVADIVNKILDVRSEMPTQRIKRQDISWAIVSSLAGRLENSKQLYRAIKFVKSLDASIDLVVFIVQAAVLRGIQLPEQEWISDDEWQQIIKAVRASLKQ